MSIFIITVYFFFKCLFVIGVLTFSSGPDLCLLPVWREDDWPIVGCPYWRIKKAVMWGQACLLTRLENKVQPEFLVKQSCESNLGDASKRNIPCTKVVDLQNMKLRDLILHE